MVCHDFVMFGSHRYCSSRYMYFVRDAIQEGHVIKRKSDYNDRSP